MSVPVGRRVAGSLLRLSSARVVAMALQFVAFASLAAHIAPAGIGIYSFAVAFVALFRIVPNFGFRTIVARDVAQQPEREADLIPNLAYLRAALGIVAYAALAGSLYLIGYSSESRRAALVAGLLLVLFTFESFLVVLEVRLKLAWAAWADVAEAVVLLAGFLVLVHLDAGVNRFLAMYVVANTLYGVIIFVAALRLGRYDWRLRLDVWRSLARAAAPVGLAALFIALYYRMDIAILQRLKPEADVGQYGAAYRFLEAAVGLAGVAMSVLAPVLSRSYSESRELLQRRTHRTFHLLLLIALPVAVIGAMIAWRLLPALPGFARFHGGGVALSILAPTASLILVGTIVQGLLVSGHEQRRLLVIASIGFILNLLLNIALIVPFSYVGAAIATTLTEVGLVLVSLREVRRRLGLALVPPRTANVIVATALLALVTVPGFFVDPYAQLAIALVAYVPALLVTRAVRPADLRGLARRDRPRPGALEPSPPSA